MSRQAGPHSGPYEEESPIPNPFRYVPRWAWAVGIVAVIGLATFGPGVVASLRATHGAVAAYTRLIAAANAQDVEAVRALCSRAYLDTHPIRAAEEGGIVGLPRNIHKNFQAWRDGQAVLLCPTNRAGPVYQFVREGTDWRFDGPIGILRGGLLVRSVEGDGGDEGEPAPP